MERDPERDRGFRERKREDHVLTLIKELTARLDDLPRVKEILRELGRYYDPVLGGGVMALGDQKAIMRALEEGRLDDARALVQARYELYIKDRIHLGGPRGEGGPEA
jgi:hypothetical protein